jgi:PBP1b-binding outer membrane lipoprotein LpoB
MKKALLFTSILLVSGCSQSYVTSYWSDPQYNAKPIQSVLVVSLSPNLRSRRLFEDDISQRLTALGTKSYASWASMQGQSLTSKSVEHWVNTNQIQTVLTAKVSEVKNKTVYYPPTNNYWSMYPTNRFWGSNYYNSAFWAPVDLGYTQTYKYVSMDFTLFDAKTGQVIWSAGTDSVDPVKLNSVMGELSTLVIDNLQKTGLIAK